MTVSTESSPVATYFKDALQVHRSWWGWIQTSGFQR